MLVTTTFQGSPVYTRQNSRTSVTPSTAFNGAIHFGSEESPRIKGNRSSSFINISKRKAIVWLMGALGLGAALGVGGTELGEGISSSSNSCDLVASPGKSLPFTLKNGQIVYGNVEINKDLTGIYDKTGQLNSDLDVTLTEMLEDANGIHPLGSNAYFAITPADCSTNTTGIVQPSDIDITRYSRIFAHGNPVGDYPISATRVVPLKSGQLVRVDLVFGSVLIDSSQYAHAH